jgi:membrane protease YdiL (CAAX protease family)
VGEVLRLILVDHLPPAFPVWLAGLLGAWLVLGAGVFFCVARLVMKGGGKVNSTEFGQADYYVAGAFVIWFALIVTNGFGGASHEVTQKEIIHGAALFLGIVVLLCAFMKYRGIDPVRQFGVKRWNPLLCVAMGVGFLIAASPIVLLTENLTAVAMNGKAQPQNVVEYFLNASEKADLKAVGLMLLLAVVVAPAAEETIFRGYIYGVLKRYMGGVGAGVLSAGLFAAMHLNLAALPALFVLAIFLTLAYEATGSILVNIFMHGFFNLSNLLVMLYLAGHPVAS